MNTTWRILLALVIAVAISACKTTEPEPEPVTEPEPAPVVEEVTTAAALDPRDFTDARNFDNSESLLSKRVIYFDFDKSDVKSEYRAIGYIVFQHFTAHTSDFNHVTNDLKVDCFTITKNDQGNGRS